MSSKSTEPLSLTELQRYLIRALTIINTMAGEGVSMEGHEDPCDIMMEFAERMGVQDEDDCWDAAMGVFWRQRS